MADLTTITKVDILEPLSSSDEESSDSSPEQTPLPPRDIPSLPFGVQLNSAESSYTWQWKKDDSCKKDEDGDVDVSEHGEHVLKLRQAVLGGDALPNERNVVRLCATGKNGDEVSYIIASLMLGVQEMSHMSLDFSGNVPITLSLIHGSGPVIITGVHQKSLKDNEDTDIESTQTEEEVLSSSSAEVELILPAPKGSNVKTRQQLSDISNLNYDHPLSDSPTHSASHNY